MQIHVLECVKRRFFLLNIYIFSKLDQILRQSSIQKSVKFSSIGSNDCCLVQENAKPSVLQRMIEKKKERI